MSGHDLFLLIFAVVGGLALFIFGMNVMTDGLREAAGTGLRVLLGKASRSRIAGIGFGTIISTLVHSGATTVMLVGFVNAGLMSLEASIPPILGANIGTTVSMQAISFHLDDYAFFAIGIGFILSLAGPNPQTKQLGKALLGFGVLFLGMKTIGDAIQPHRETLAPILASIHSDSISGLLIGILAAAGLTAIWQSSGATIAMCFALIHAGVFVDVEQIYPIVLGAHLGTCTTAILGSLGTNIEARRCALAHLLFNIQNVVLAVLAKPFFLWLVVQSSDSITRQVANLHTLVMVATALLVLPASAFQARLVRKLTPSRKPQPEPSHLDPALLPYPEKALVACIWELQRVAKICMESFVLTSRIMVLLQTRHDVQLIRNNEKVLDEVKISMKAFLADMTHHYLSRRQTLMIQHLNRCMTDIERIGDHIDKVTDISISRVAIPEAILDKESLERLFQLYLKAEKVLELVIKSLDPNQEKFQETARGILDARDQYVAASLSARNFISEKISLHGITPIASIFFNEYMTEFDRVVRHSKSIALAELQPNFWIKRKKIDKHATKPEHFELPERIDPEDFLDKLHGEDAL